MSALPGNAAWIGLRTVADATGRLAIAESGDRVPFPIARVFVVHGVAPGTVRGNHAHKRCAQIFVCLAGKVEVTLSDGEAEQTVMLQTPDRGLLIPPMIWTRQRYAAPDTLLMVLCDTPFEEGEYIRDFEAFRAYRAGG